MLSTVRVPLFTFVSFGFTSAHSDLKGCPAVAWEKRFFLGCKAETKNMTMGALKRGTNYFQGIKRGIGFSLEKSRSNLITVKNG